MKSLVKKIKDHKVLSAVLGIWLVCFIGVGTAFGLHQAKIANTQKALLMAQDGYIDSDELKQLGEDIALGEEVVAPDGSTVVITRDANGNLVTTTVKDAEGHNTGAVVPGGGEVAPAPVGHTHTWVAHYATRQVETGTKYVVDVASQPIYTKRSVCCCNECGQELTNGLHVHNGILCGSGNIIKTILTGYTQEQGHNEPVYTTEQYIDYYYCSECGVRQ